MTDDEKKKSFHYVQVLRRFNEAIALDYVIPFRVVPHDKKFFKRVKNSLRRGAA